MLPAPRTYRALFTFLIMICASTTVAGQDQTKANSPKMPVITASASGSAIRFSSLAETCQMRIEILTPGGEPLLDSSWEDGNLLDWTPQIDGEPLADGSYRCLAMAKDLNGAVTEQETTLNVENGQLSFEQPSGSGRLTIVGPDENGPKITLLAHDGTNGAIVSTSGDLSFRFGNFLAAKDVEKMRLTADGKLGIGTDTPQEALDVNGVIRTSGGIMFPDGTILTSAAGLPGVQESAGSVRQRPSAAGRAGGWLLQNRGPLLPLSPPHRKIAPTVTPDYQFKVTNSGVIIGTTSSYGLSVGGDVALSSNLDLPATSSSSAGVITLGGIAFAHAYGNSNAFLGTLAGNFTMTGTNATAIGDHALQLNTSGNFNTAIGSIALEFNSSGAQNTAVGAGALEVSTFGNYNTASGFEALVGNTSGSSNTATGHNALFSNTTGSNNIAIGEAAGTNLTTNDDNIDIGNAGVAAEGATIRIGTVGTQTRTFIAGINGVTTGGQAVAVYVDANGQLGTISSSRRYKYDIEDMGSATDGLMRLRPVTFRYIAQGDNAPMQYGLIAEEVAEVYPGLVTRNKEGQPETVMYQFLAPMLLNEVQKQHQAIENQTKTIETQAKEIDVLSKTLAAMGKRLDALEKRATQN